MSKIVKLSSGFLYSEDFKDRLSMLWDFDGDDVNDRVAVNSDSISLLPKNNKRFEMFIKIPDKKGYVFQTEVDYTPSDGDEVAGVVLRAITHNFVQASIDGTNMEFCRYLKIDIVDGLTIHLKASMDGVNWYTYGNTSIADANTIGYFIDRTSITDEFKILNCRMFKNNFVTINNIDKKYRVKIFNKEDEDITNQFLIRKMNTKAVLDCTNLVLPIKYLKFKIFDFDGNLVNEHEMEDIYGGDCYELESNITVTVNDNVLNDSLYDLGNIAEDTMYTIKIENHESFAMNKTLYVECLNPYNNGDLPVFISLANEDNYEKVKTFQLKPYEIKEFKLLIKKDKEMVVIDDSFKFKISLE